MKLNHAVTLGCACAMLAACGTKAIKPSDKHIQQTPEAAKQSSGVIPQTSKNAVVLPPPTIAKKVETYSVVVSNLPARDILFALARDAKLNIDIHPGLEGEVTINAINQTLPQILDRISKQVEMRYELNDNNLVVMPDSPYLKSYKIDYVNMSRDAEGGITNTSQVGSGAAGGAAGGNNSKLAITNTSKNHFWDTLVKNITDILRETDKILPEGSSETVIEQSSTNTTTPQAKKSTAKNATDGSGAAATIEGEGTTVTRRNTFREAASVIPNPESGIITVRATGRQHEKIQEFITHVMRNARRQVLIEATIAEVRLSSSYQQGINWSKLVPAGTKGISIGQAGTALRPDSAAATVGALVLNYTDPASKFGSLSGSVSLLETFGDVKVLSSPKLSVLNNQTAMLRVVDNNVYFIVNSTTTPCSPAPCTPIVTYTTTVNTVPVGFSMSITPQINENDTVLLNVRPTITRLLASVTDPTPGLVVTNKIPQVSTREMESVLKIENNQIAILGGLMQDEINNQTDGIPGLSSIPFAGNAFKSRDDSKQKTELVIFLRPVVIKDSSLDGDYSAYKDTLPDENYLKPEDEKAKR
ncbi:MAG: pilus (MSHA type) biogenesis protein MshL [Sideroxydans sp.]|nr:pilus (MSHA type) biogenesis protein MshL [Sideroxydans sp.]